MTKIKQNRKVWIKIYGYEFEVSTEKAEEFRRLQRRIRYLEVNIKYQKFDRKMAKFIPSKEDSLDRLMEQGKEFSNIEKLPEDFVIDKIQIEQLRESIKHLRKFEQQMIDALFYQEKSETEYAQELGVSQQYISKLLKETLKNCIKC